MYSQLIGSGDRRRRIHYISSVAHQRGGQPVIGAGAGCRTSRFMAARLRLYEYPLAFETRAGESDNPNTPNLAYAHRDRHPVNDS